MDWTPKTRKTEYAATATADGTPAFENDKKNAATSNMMLYIICDDCEYI